MNQLLPTESFKSFSCSCQRREKQCTLEVITDPVTPAFVYITLWSYCILLSPK